MFQNLIEVTIATDHGFEVLNQYRKHKSKQAVKGLVQSENTVVDRGVSLSHNSMNMFAAKAKYLTF